MNLPASDAASPWTPDLSVVGLHRRLCRHAPFSDMPSGLVDRFVAASVPRQHAAGAVLLSPADGVVDHLHCVIDGSLTGHPGGQGPAEAFAIEAGDCFPVGAVLQGRAVSSTYVAETDVLCASWPVARVRELAASCQVFADFLQRRAGQLAELARRAAQRVNASHTLEQPCLERPLGELPRHEPVRVSADAMLREALALMHARGVGSVLVDDGAGRLRGILTRHDVLGRVVLAQRPLTTPISEVMSAPVVSATVADTAQDAVLTMSRHGVRHLPVLEEGRVVSVVSERDLFALQRLTLQGVGAAIRRAPDLAALVGQALAIRQLARNLLGQGIQARQLTALVSHLNDLLTERLVLIVARRRWLDPGRACWLTFGSEGRGEQTVATDQDNGLVFTDDAPALERTVWRDFAREVNEGLDACGYPLCKGGIMASNPMCCLTAQEWQDRFEHWMAHGAPQDLLNASIYFDLRPVAGRLDLAYPLRALITQRAAALPRFVKQLAGNALRARIPLNWRGAVDPSHVDGRPVIDLKLQGAALYVDAARIFALAHGVSETSTRARLEGYALRAGVPVHESSAWVTGFEFLQSLRLRVQLGGDPVSSNPNLLDLSSLDDIEARMLREALRAARQLQQRLELDYMR